MQRAAASENAGSLPLVHQTIARIPTARSPTALSPTAAAAVVAAVAAALATVATAVAYPSLVSLPSLVLGILLSTQHSKASHCLALSSLLQIQGLRVKPLHRLDLALVLCHLIERTRREQSLQAQEDLGAVASLNDCCAAMKLNVRFPGFRSC